MKKPHNTTLTFRVDPRFHQMLKAVADAQKRTQKATIELLISQSYERIKEKGEG